jgi:hypothetical protein
MLFIYDVINDIINSLDQASPNYGLWGESGPPHTFIQPTNVIKKC